MTRFTVQLVAVVFACYVGLCYFAYRRYRAALFPTPQEKMPVAIPGATLLQLHAADGVIVHALHDPAPEGGRTVVYFHGNNDTIGQSCGFAMDLHARGLGAMLVEYRGYGLSHGASSEGEKPTEAGLYADARAALDALDGLGVHHDDIVLWGTSLGTGIAAQMAREHRGSALVLVSPYTSIIELGAHYFPFLPAGWIVRDRFDTLSKARDIRVPTLIVHGDADEVIPYSMGLRLVQAIEGAELITVRGGHHNDLFQLDGTHLMGLLAAFSMTERS